MKERKLAINRQWTRVFSRKCTHDQLVELICEHERHKSKGFARMNENWYGLLALVVNPVRNWTCIVFATSH